jgi:hypothetical protein
MTPSSPAGVSLRPARAASVTDIHCQQCGKLIFDGQVLLARVTRFGPGLTEACCKICKTWVKVPVVIATTDRGRSCGHDKGSSAR